MSSSDDDIPAESSAWRDDTENTVSGAAALGNHTSETLDLAQDFIFDNGDVRILIKHNDQVLEGKVSSHALCLASPVWKKFLFPPWKDESLPDGVKQIDCTEDDSIALLILLDIAHLKFQKIPSRLSYQIFFQVAVLCDLYDCANLVRPWLLETLWLADEDTECLKAGQSGWLFIAWVFGRASVFEKLTNDMIWSTQVHEEESWLKIAPMSHDIIESIISLQKATIESLLKIPYDLLDKYERNIRTKVSMPESPSKFTVCSEGTREEYCDAIVYGSVVLGLQLVKLFPRLRSEDVIMSVKELAISIQEIEVLHLPGTKKSSLSHHENCGVKDFRDQVQSILVEPQNPTLELYRRHMQARK